MKARKRGAAGADIAVQRLDDNRYVRLSMESCAMSVRERNASGASQF